MELNQIYIGDCLDIMGSWDAESIDLIYLDPPFNSRRNHIEFDDTWGSAENYINYLIPRLKELHRLLKPTGSIYLHVDMKEVHYIKIEMDKIFGRKNYLNQIAWCYNSAGIPIKYYAAKHDPILFYAKERGNNIFNPLDLKIERSDAGIKRYNKQDEGGRYYIQKVRGRTYKRYFGIRAQKHRGNKTYDYITTEFYRHPLDWWTELRCLQPTEKERVNYPTQKPLSLLDRIIKASSDEGDVVLDPFCGSGTTLVAANKLKRNYVGIDMNKNVVDIINKRLTENFGL